MANLPLTTSPRGIWSPFMKLGQFAVFYDTGRRGFDFVLEHGISGQDFHNVAGASLVFKLLLKKGYIDEVIKYLTK